MHCCSNIFGQPSIHGNTYNLYVYSLTDFSSIDTLEHWNYTLDLTYKPIKNDSVSPIGLLTFSRTRPIDDSISLEADNISWQPSISFEIYNLSDTSYCYRKSELIRIFSSCSPPNVGGDCFVFGNFVFLNSQVCVKCSNNSTKLDFCRPLVNYVFNKLTDKTVTNLADLSKQFIIKSNND